MRTLESYIKENNQIGLNDYIIDEGLIKWFKKIWKRIFSASEKNKKYHGGYYRPYKYIKTEIESDNPKFNDNTNNLNSTNVPKYDCEKIEKSKLIDLIKNLKTENNTNPFFAALDYCQNQNDKKSVLFLTTVSKNDKTDFLCIIAGDKKDKQFIIDEVFWNECIRKQYGINKNFSKGFFNNVIRKDISDTFGDIEEKNVGPAEKFNVDD